MLVTAVVEVRNPMQARASRRGPGIDAVVSFMTLSFFAPYNLGGRHEFPAAAKKCSGHSKMNEF